MRSFPVTPGFAAGFPVYSQALGALGNDTGTMDTPEDHSNQLALDELTKIAAVDITEHRQSRVHVGVELGPHVLAFEGHDSGRRLIRNHRRRQFALATLDGAEVVQERLHSLDAGVLSVPVHKFSWQRLGDPRLNCDRLPQSGTRRAKLPLEVVKNGFHADIVFPCMGSRQPIYGKGLVNTPATGSAAMSEPLLQIVGENLSRLMAAKPALGSTTLVEKASAEAGFAVGKSTVHRVTQGATPVNLKVIESLAKTFGIDPWQLLVPRLDPKNLPTIGEAGHAQTKLIAEVVSIAHRIVALAAAADLEDSGKAANDSRPMGFIDTEGYRGPDRRGS